MATFDFFYNAAMAEKGGFGIWYEYLAKSRIFKRFSSLKNVLIFGLPEKYSLGLDTLFFAENSKLSVLDSREKPLGDYKKFAEKFKRNIKTANVQFLGEFKSKKKYDLVISTEVIQNDFSLISTIKSLGKTIIIFVPNKKCYAHPRISGLNSMSIKELAELGKKNGLKVIDKGYIDCPPWPAGACLPKSEDLNKELKDPLYIKIVKSILTKLVPLLVKFELFYPSPLKELNSHMIYCIFENE